MAIVSGVRAPRAQITIGRRDGPAERHFFLPPHCAVFSGGVIHQEIAFPQEECGRALRTIIDLTHLYCSIKFSEVATHPSSRPNLTVEFLFLPGHMLGHGNKMLRQTESRRR
jgi:hypothetical protein